MKRESYRSSNEANRKALEAAREKSMRMERQLVRVIDTDHRGSKIFLLVVVPKWNDSAVVRIPLAALPKEWRLHSAATFPAPMRKGFRFYAQVNMRAKAGSELNISAPFERGGQPNRRRLTDHQLSRAMKSKVPKVPLPPVSTAYETEVAEWYDGLAHVRKALLADFGDEDHSECGHDVGHCVHSEAFGILFTKAPPVVPSLKANELAEVSATLTAAKTLLDRMDVTMNGASAQAIDPHAPLHSVLHGIFRAQQLMQVGEVRLKLAGDLIAKRRAS